MEEQLDNNLQHPVYQKDVVEFVTVSNELCKLLEQSANYKRSEYIDRLQKLIPLLYLKTAVLKVSETPSEDEWIEKFVQEADWNYVKTLVAERLSEMDVFVDLLLPLQNVEDEATSMSISECLTDTYQDLKDFTTLYQIASPEAIYAALWEVTDNFKHVWGPRLLASVQILHNLKYGEKMLDNPNNEPDEHAQHQLVNKNAGYKIDTSSWLINQHFNNSAEQDV